MIFAAMKRFIRSNGLAASDAFENGLPFLSPRRSKQHLDGLSGRFSSRGQAEMANRLLSAMRNRFGGHVETKG